MKIYKAKMGRTSNAPSSGPAVASGTARRHAFMHSRGFRLLLTLGFLAFLWNFHSMKAWADANSDIWGVWFFDAILGGLQSFFGWCTGLFWGSLDGLLGQVTMPVWFTTMAWTTVINWVNTINYWFPLDVLLSALAFYWLVSIELTLYRIVKSFIPTISG